MDNSSNSFKEKLDSVHSFPSLYLFKFIVLQEQLDEVKKLFAKHEVKITPSRNGKYVSTSIHVMVASSDEIIATYEKAKKIEGIISL
ncbi:MAG: DUF493 domain-containing protein [Reichenbachiella sp.]